MAQCTRKKCFAIDWFMCSFSSFIFIWRTNCNPLLRKTNENNVEELTKKCLTSRTSHHYMVTDFIFCTHFSWSCRLHFLFRLYFHSLAIISSRAIDWIATILSTWNQKRQLLLSTSSNEMSLEISVLFGERRLMNEIILIQILCEISTYTCTIWSA